VSFPPDPELLRKMQARGKREGVKDMTTHIVQKWESRRPTPDEVELVEGGNAFEADIVLHKEGATSFEIATVADALTATDAWAKVYRLDTVPVIYLEDSTSVAVE
jgi:hypothetical protein